MSIITIFAIAIIQSITADEYIPAAEVCAEEGGHCYCDDGYVYYGYGSTWVTKGTKGGQDCSNSVFGDPVRGIVKSCSCLTHLLEVGESCAEEGEYCSCEGEVLYGSEVYWTSGIGNQICSSANYVGANGRWCTCVKPQAEVYPCANEGEFCSCDGTVSYGAISSWVSADGDQICNNGNFGDPIRGVAKTCVCTTMMSDVSICAEEGKFCSCDDVVLFGGDDHWVTGNGNQLCISDNFVDPGTNSCLCFE